MQKGRLLELIVEEMHRVPGVSVKQHVYLTVPGTTRRREIDVLVVGSVAGYPVQLAFECKNYGRVIQAPDIDAFVGKLQDVRIPTACGLYVSTRGFSKGAVQRAEDAGIRPLLLTGLDTSRLAALVEEAIHSTVLILPFVVEWRVVSDVKAPKQDELFAFRDDRGAFAGTVADLFARAWLSGAIPRAPGRHHVKLSVPPGWHHVFDGIESPPHELSGEILVRAAVVNKAGTLEQHALVDEASRHVQKVLLKAKFELRPGERASVLWFDSEESLQHHLTHRAAPFKATVRLLAPRIRFGPAYWPLSTHALNALEALRPDHAAGKLSDEELRTQFQKLDGESLDRLWDPPAR